MQIQSELVQGVKVFLDCGDRAFLTTMHELDRDSIEAQATIRYLMQLKHWPLTPDSDFADLIDRFFGAYPERKALPAEEYQKITFDLIKDAWNYECIVVVPEPREEKPVTRPKPGKQTSKPRMQSEDESAEDGESGSRTFKSIREHDAENS